MVTKFCSFKFGELLHVQKHGGLDSQAGFSSCKEYISLSGFI
jgi:hypothetical protein